MGRAKVKSAKRKVTEKKDVKEKTEMEEGSGDNVLESGDPATKPTELIDNKGLRKGKRAKKTAKEGSSFPKPKEEPEYFTEKRNLEDLWQAAFPVGTEWDNLEKLQCINWSFLNLENAFEEGGELHGKKVYLFGCTEPQMLFIDGQQKITCIPVVVAVVSPFPPSDKVGIKSIQRVEEEIIPMKAMKMGWVPYIPLDDRNNRLDRVKTQIYTLACTQRRSALRHLKIDRIKKYEYCLPYFYQPFQEDEDDDDTVISIMYPMEPPIVRDFDMELDEIEEFTDELIKDELLPEDQKEAFKTFVKERARERKKAQREAKAARKKAREDMDEKTKAAFENIRFYKFYPVPTSDTPDLSAVKSPFINRYYGKAHFVL
ncbi:unknownprotein [Zostera marina]|uniref:Uncharacterized protein n=1 Tax=Zostera marina TaxID=29655 RepID=A0A0K9NKY0_ZOSMR|nr:unknownprotein [Zostera marina]